ncbi:GNAT family N-acetyltransferase [Legionella taurinensis]|uniref:GNAT family N-acetyltransferase n=1 Tax=Legionella taurinensis TaxID=70611 RepID=UPI000E060D37|nr:GNAT family protein [Legionella taurinensis]STY25119.1 Putative ribosomal N-acetyltransferase YdaF [Legionella taurinensis]
MKPILINLPMPIITPRLLIRPTQVNDGKAVNAAILESYEELHRFMDWAKTKPSVEDSEEQARLAAANWILKRNEEPWLQLFIYDKTTGEFIGGTGYHHILWEVPSVETGYWIRSSRAKEGLMTEAINAITQYAFKQLGVKRMAITCDLDNSRSRMIPERLNYTLEATLKSNRKKPITGEISDTLVYAKYDLDNLPNLNVNWPTE